MTSKTYGTELKIDSSNYGANMATFPAFEGEF